ncbi:MAG: CPBP family intramembrane metalloprotease [Planctomycetes bacterium]|nr:CPBP family intramembrane metalloprotease [Planctomycetota bacterium]
MLAAPAGTALVMVLSSIFAAPTAVAWMEMGPGTSTTTAPPQASARLPQLSTQEWVMLALIVGGPIVLVMLFVKGWLRPGGLKAAGARQVNGLAWWEWLMGALIPLMAAAFAQPAGMKLLGVSEGDTDSPRGAFLESACAFVPGVAVAIFLARLMNKSAPSAGLSPSKTDAPFGLAGFAMAVPVIVFSNWVGERIYTQLTGQTMPTIGHSTLASIVEYKDDPWTWGTVAISVIVAPMLEEIVYRGFLQSMIVRLTGIPGLAVVLTSAVFTWMHWPSVEGSWPALVPIAVLSLGLGIAMERSKRIGVPIVMHMAFNAVNIALAVLR